MLLLVWGRLDHGRSVLAAATTRATECPLAARHALRRVSAIAVDVVLPPPGVDPHAPGAPGGGGRHVLGGVASAQAPVNSRRNGGDEQMFGEK